MSKIVFIHASALEHVLAFAGGSALAVPCDSEALPESIVWMPAGTHEIAAHTVGGGSYAGTAICDEQAFRAINASFLKMQAAGQRVWFDFNHEDAEASAWVKSFSWDAEKGILAHLDWTPDGGKALRDKSFYTFSPAFALERETGRVVSLLKGHAAGGLVNAAAFTAMPALIAARMSGFTTQQTAPGGPRATTKDTMNPSIIALLAALKITPPANCTDEQATALIIARQNEITAANEAAVQAAKATKDAADLAAVQAAKVEADKQKVELAEIKASLAAIKAGATAAGAGPGVIQVTASVEDTIKGYALLGNTNESASERGLFYKNNIAPVIAKMGGRLFSENLSRSVPVLARNVAIQANTLGTLTGNLIAQQALALLKYEFPILSVISTDFSNASAQFNQSVLTRLKGALSASQYTSAYTAAAATLTDVTVTINHHPYCQVAFNANELASTNRDLFGEQAEVVQYALAVDMVNAIHALITSGNFTTTPLKLATGTDGTTYTRAAAVAAAKQLFKNKVPRKGRFNLLNSDAFGALASDSAVVSLAAYQKPEIITGYELPPIADMQPIQAVNLPFTGGMVGFAGHARCLALATRVPNDYTKALPGGNYGAVSTVTDPDTGITVMVTQYVDHNAGTSNYRVAVMYGVAVGDPLAGVITEEAAGS